MKVYIVKIYHSDLGGDGGWSLQCIVHKCYKSYEEALGVARGCSKYLGNNVHLKGEVFEMNLVE